MSTFSSGGRVHGPVPRSYKYSLPKKVRRMGLRTALSVRYAQVSFTFCSYMYFKNTLEQILHRSAMHAHGNVWCKTDCEQKSLAHKHVMSVKGAMACV